TRLCHNCGRNADEDSQFCKHCGSALNRSTQPAASGVARPMSSKTTLMVILVGVLVVGLILIILIIGSRRNSSLAVTSNSSETNSVSAQQVSPPTPSRTDLTRETVSNLVKSRMT